MSLKKISHNTANFGSSIPKKIDKETENELREAFVLFDPKGSNQIDARELKAIMVAFGIQINKEGIKEIFKSFQKDITDTINYEEYKIAMSSRLVIIY